MRRTQEERWSYHCLGLESRRLHSRTSSSFVKNHVRRRRKAGSIIYEDGHRRRQDVTSTCFILDTVTSRTRSLRKKIFGCEDRVGRKERRQGMGGMKKRKVAGVTREGSVAFNE
jgi:hypothetical protein